MTENSAPFTLHERIVAHLVKSYPDNSPGEWAVVTETLDFLLALPVEQRMEAMGMKPSECRFCGADPALVDPDELCDDEERHAWTWVAKS